MKTRLSVMFVTALVMVLISLAAPAAFAKKGMTPLENISKQNNPNEGVYTREINELKNRHQQTSDPRKRNHLKRQIKCFEQRETKGDEVDCATGDTNEE